MQNNKPSSFIFIIVALILGSALYKHFDFQNLKFEKPALDTVYLITFVVSIYFIIKNFMNRPQK
jgi:hypothetical protein